MMSMLDALRRLSGAFFLTLFSGVLPPPVAAEPDHRMTVVQLNDVYEIFPVTVSAGDKAEKRGGMAYVATAVKELRAQGPVLLLHAGDMLSPSLLSTKLKHRGAQMVAALNVLSLDAATFGNHEFDFGCRTVLDRVRESNFPWVVANVDWPAVANMPPGKIGPTLILERAGLRIGVFGVTVPLAPVTGCGAEAITFRDPVAATRKAVADLKRANVDVIVGLTHLRMEEDKALAAAVPGIDLIVGGHEHEVLAAKVGGTPIVKSGVNAINLGLVRIAANRVGNRRVLEKEWQVLAMDAAKISADPAMEALFAPYRKELAGYAKVIGQIAMPLDAREDTLREGESNLGDYVADLMRDRMKADVALINGGGFRDDRIIPAGPLTLGDLNTLLPFTNELVVVEVTGAQLRAALENGVSLAGQGAGRFPQISGMSFRYSRGLPVGRRVGEVLVGGRPLEPERHYTLATTGFLVERGEIDGYTGLLPKTVLRRGGDLNAAIVAHIQVAGSIRASLDGRIQRVR
jgi:5'-nucleotidase